MKTLKLFILVLFLTNIIFLLEAQTQESQLIQTNIPAPSLENNLFGTITEQMIAIYLPPSYNTSDEKFPVVYFLPGFSTPVSSFLNGTFQGFRLKQSMDNLINDGKIKEMIVVIPNGLTFMLGSFYTNSTVRGNWEDFIVEDVTGYIDSTCRTLPDAASRGIAGHSMGGYGALNLAMLHPDVFSAAYGLSPGLFDENGLSNQGMFSSQLKINTFLAKQEEWAEMGRDSAVAAFKGYINYLRSRNDNNTVFSYAYGTAFSPNADANPPNIYYPYYQSGNEVLCDSTLLQNYENGFGGLAEKIELYKGNLLMLKAITIDYGLNDYYNWIPRGCVYFSELLKGASIPHELLKFNGGHGDKVRQRIENYILPSFSNILEFDPRFSSVSGISYQPVNFNLGNYPNPFNSSTIIWFNLPKSYFVTLKIYNILGKEIESLINENLTAEEYKLKWDAKDLSSGMYIYRLKAGTNSIGSGQGFVITKKLILLK